jgi:cytochrome P450
MEATLIFASVLTKSSHVEAVFRDSHKHTKAHANDSGHMMDQLLGSCLGLISGKPWENLKQAVELPFLHQSTTRYVREIEEFTKAYMAQLRSRNDAFRDNGSLHPVRDLRLLPFLFVASIIYGKLSENLQNELVDMVPDREALFKSVIRGGITRFWFAQFLPLPAIRSLHSFKTRWASWNDRVQQTARCQVSDMPPIVGMYDSVARGAMTREQLLQTLDEMLFANLDVTMGGISWPLVFLATHPAFQDELRGEMHAHAQPEARSAYLLSSFRSSPTLLGACLLEAARLRPLAAFSVPQSCPTARVLDGFEIPAGTKFVIDSYALNIRDEFWGKDREKFIPQRWLDGFSSGRDLRYRYFRFGFGPRTCLGKYVAELMLRAVVVEVLENWQLSLDVGSQANGEGKRDDATCSEEMSWPWDDETWIHHPNLTLKCGRLIN